MADSFQFAVSAVCPLFLTMALGYGLNRRGVFDEPFLTRLNALCFQVFLPLLLFDNVYRSDVTKLFEPDLVVFALAGIATGFALVLCAVPIFEKDGKRRGVLVQGICRGNYILFGIPLAAALFGDDQIGVTAGLIGFVVPVMNILSVVALSVFEKQRVSLKKVLIGIAKNPLIIAAAIAFAFVLTGARLPAAVQTTITDLAKAAAPLSFLVLGGSFSFSRLAPNWKPLCAAALGKLVLIPLILIPAAAAMGFRGAQLGALLALFASPAAVSGFTMAQSMNADHTLAGQIVIVTSLLSVFTILLWITALKQLGLI